jgi:hypothetical protein
MQGLGIMLGAGSFFGAVADVVSKYVFGQPPLHWVSILFAVTGIIAGFFLARAQRTKHKAINDKAVGSKAMSKEFSGEEERAFQDQVDSMHIGNDHSKVSDARDLWNAGKAFAASMPVNNMKRVSILKEVNVRTAASSEGRLLSNQACPSQGLFKVVYGPLGSDGVPIDVKIVSLGDWDIENIADGTILYSRP